MREFNKLWAGQSVSLMGSQITDLALPLTAVYVLHAQAAEVGLLSAARWLPWALFALWAGAWLDRRRRLPVLIAADAVRAVLLGGVVALAIAGLLTVPLLVAVVFAVGTATVLFEVGYQACLPAIVTQDELMAANSKLSASGSVAQVGGPGLGGLLVQLLSAPVALIVDAVSFAVSAASLAWIRAEEPRLDTGPHQKGRVREGLRMTLSDPLLRALIGTAASYNLFSSWVIVLLPLFAVKELGLSAGMIGLILSTGAVGALLGSFLVKPAVRRFGIGASMLWPVVVETLALLLVPLATAETAVPMLGSAFFLNGAGVALSGVVATSVRQSVTPAGMLGRMTATYRTISFGVVALGTFLGGMAGTLIGLRAGTAVGAIGLLSAIAWVAVPPLRTTRELPALKPSEAPGPLAVGQASATR